MPLLQSTDHLLFVRPAVFYANPETFSTNAYQAQGLPAAPGDLLEKARAEIEGFTGLLAAHGVKITMVPGSPACPDHIFPGNWASTHQGGGLCFYPMFAPNRRLEKTPEIVSFLRQGAVDEKDYTSFADKGKFLEGTGSFCLDRVNKIAWLATSARSDAELAGIWARDMGYELASFPTRERGGLPVYHTDLMMFTGTTVCGLCSDIIADSHRAGVVKKVSDTHEIVEISVAQMDEMCGNALEVRGKDDALYLVMSSRAFNAFSSAQKDAFGKHYRDILHTPLPTVETYGGGSARCLILELFY